MSNEMNTPWEARAMYDDPDDYQFREVVDSKEMLVGIFPTHLAAHIVKCVNSHDALVEALHQLERVSGIAMMRDDPARVNARKVLAAATRKSIQGDGK